MTIISVCFGNMELNNMLTKQILEKAHEGKRLKDKLPTNTNFQKNIY